MNEADRCPRCGAPLVLKGGRKQEAKAKATLFLTMRVERSFVCPKCSYETKSHTVLMK